MSRIEDIFKRLDKVFAYINFTFKILAIVVVLFLILELASFAILKFYRAEVVDVRAYSEAYGNQEWTKEYYTEFRGIEVKYAPYISYRLKPVEGKYINVDEESVRRTHNPCSSEDNKTIKIFFFGGSTAWGTGARDEYTIPSQLSGILCDRGYSVNVINYGETGYTNTQEMLKLLLELRKNNTPDIVIFYDGINDVYSSLQNRVAGIPQNIEKREIEFGLMDDFNILRPIVMKSNFLKLTQKFLEKIVHLDLKKKEPNLSDNEKLELCKDTADVYFNNIRIVQALEDEYGFKSFFFWQPLIYTKQNLSSEEIMRVNDERNRFTTEDREETIKLAYSTIDSRISSMEDNGVYSLSNSFNNYSKTIYIDFGHISEEGNYIIAKEIGDSIADYMEDTENGKKQEHST